MATPSCEPIPPSAIARMVANSMKVKLSGLTNPWRTEKNEPAKPAKHRPQREGRELGVGGVDAERTAGNLVLAQRLPGPSDRQPAKPNGDEIGEEREREDQIEEEDRAIDRREGQMEDRGETVVVIIEGNAEERNMRNTGDAGVAVGQSTQFMRTIRMISPNASVTMAR